MIRPERSGAGIASLSASAPSAALPRPGLVNLLQSRMGELAEEQKEDRWTVRAKDGLAPDPGLVATYVGLSMAMTPAAQPMFYTYGGITP